MTRASQVLNISLYNNLDNRTHIIGGDYAKYQDCQVSDYQLLPDISPAAGVESKYLKKFKKCTAATCHLATYPPTSTGRSARADFKTGVCGPVLIGAKTGLTLFPTRAAHHTMQYLTMQYLTMQCNTMPATTPCNAYHPPPIKVNHICSRSYFCLLAHFNPFTFCESPSGIKG